MGCWELKVFILHIFVCFFPILCKLESMKSPVLSQDHSTQNNSKNAMISQVSRTNPLSATANCLETGPVVETRADWPLALCSRVDGHWQHGWPPAVRISTSSVQCSWPLAVRMATGNTDGHRKCRGPLAMRMATGNADGYWQYGWPLAVQMADGHWQCIIHTASGHLHWQCG